ncbi:MAG: DegT/DnrJ/EryC1/StrS family aminotransferase, partial [Dehalococcoidia bacterium]
MTQPTVPFVDLKRQYNQIRTEINAAIQAVLDDTAFIGGHRISDFETAFASFTGSDHCVAVGNGTDALEIVFEALFDEPGEIIVPANSFIATSEAVSRSGHSVVFADVDPATYTLDPKDVARRITDRTVGVVAVHLYGQPARMGPLRELCEEAGIKLIEDAAQAHGAEYRGRRIGALSSAATFSFYPGKNLGAYGDAGAITCSDPELADRMRMIANHGRLAKYDHAIEGRNSRMDGIQAAVLGVKLQHLEEWTEHRRRLAQIYSERLAGIEDLILPVEDEGVRHVYHLFVVRTAHRDRLREWLTKRSIATGIHYPTALPRLQAYASHPQHDEPFKAVEMATQLLSLPMADSILESEVEEVCVAVRE